MKNLKIMLFAFICFFAVGILDAKAYVFIGANELNQQNPSFAGKKGTATWDNTTKTLTLDNFTIGYNMGTDEGLIDITRETDVTIVLKGTNYLYTYVTNQNGLDYGGGINVGNANLTIKSADNNIGTLRINGGVFAIKANSIAFDNCNLVINSVGNLFNVTPTFTNLGNKKVYVSANTDGSNNSLYTTGELTNYKNVTTYVAYDITVDKDENSVVSLSTSVVKVGESVEATISAKEGYKLISVLVNNVEQLPLTDGKLTISNVNADTTIKVVTAIDDITIDAPVVDTTKEVKKTEVGVEKDDTLKDNMKKTIENEKIDISNIDTLVKVNISELNKENMLETEVNTINDLAKKENLNVLSYFDISVAVINKSNNEVINQLSNLNKPMNFQVVLSSESINTNKDIKRTYYIIRYHNRKAEIIDAKLDGNVLTFASDKFSTYAIAYNDTAINKNDNIITNPKTSDNVITYVVMSILSASVLLGSGVIYKKRFN